MLSVDEFNKIFRINGILYRFKNAILKHEVLSESSQTVIVVTASLGKRR
jgi:hypothetical protein